MWNLKFRYSHSDCLFAHKLQQLNLSGFFHYLGTYTENNKVYSSAILKLSGDRPNIQKYIKYLKDHKTVVNIEIYPKFDSLMSISF